MTEVYDECTALPDKAWHFQLVLQWRYNDQQVPLQHFDGRIKNDSALSLGRMLTLSMVVNMYFNYAYQWDLQNL